MTNLQQKQEQDALKPNLTNKEQLNSIITNKNGSPDYLAINIYWDTLRSWYNPKIGYQKDGNIYYINKLKTKGVFLNYARLAEIHGCSTEAIRQKLVKLERLGFVRRSFQHIKTVTTKSYNQLIVYIWKDTPHFYNSMGIDSSEVPILIPQTNYQYIEKKYKVIFALNLPQEQAILETGGIQACLDTKELNNIKEVIDLGSNFLQNFKEKKAEEFFVSKIVSFPKKRLANQRKKPTNTERKASVYKCFKYVKPKTLADMYPLLDRSICDELRSKSTRWFSDNFITQRVLMMSNKPAVKASFKYKSGFIAYMVKVLQGELHDPVKSGNINFRLKANITQEDKDFIRRERFLSEKEGQPSDLENRVTGGFQKLSVLEIVDKFQTIK